MVLTINAIVDTGAGGVLGGINVIFCLWTRQVKTIMYPYSSFIQQKSQIYNYKKLHLQFLSAFQQLHVQ
jgi:hypothetical protein